MDTLVYKQDWVEAKRRWSAFWAGERLDRPCMMVHAPRAGGPPAPPAPADSRERWADVGYLIASDEARHASTWYLGEAVPVSATMMVAWAAAYGAPVEFRHDTVWIGKRFASWEEAPEWETAWDCEGWQLLKRTAAAIAEHAGGRYLVAMPPMLVPNDLLAALRGNEEFLIDLIECPDAVERALPAMTASYLRQYAELADILDCRTLGYSSWMPFWSAQPFGTPQSDLSCMLSRGMFERFIVPELEALCRAWPNVFYHLDGPGALHHLDRLLCIEGISGIQWVPGAGQPDDWRTWRWVHERIAAAGKRVWIACPPEDVQEVIAAFPPERLLISTWAASREEGQTLLHAAVGWTAGRW